MSQFENDDIDSFFAEMQDVKPIASDDKALLHDPEKALAEKQKRAARQMSTREKLANPLSMVYKMAYLKNFALENTL